MITRFFSNRGRQGRRGGPKKLTAEDVKRKAHLKQIGEETRAAFPKLELRDPRIKSAYTSTYMTTRCAPIPPAISSQARTEIVVLDSDTFDAAESLHTANAQFTTGVMNMASERNVGGGFLEGAPAQEETLCRRSTLYPCLLAVKDNYYPISPAAVLVSPDIAVFRRGVDDDFRFLAPDEVFFVTVISVAAVRNPKIQNDRFENHSDRQLTLTKIRETLRAAYHAGCRQLVLGALGCGAFHNPPEAVAELFRQVLLDPEFSGAFEKIVFAVIDRKGLVYGKRQTDNFAVFSKALHNLHLEAAPKAAAPGATSAQNSEFP